MEPTTFENVGDVIDTRALTLDGDRKVEVRIGRPERLSDSEEWCCRQQIIGIGSERVKQITGGDSVQALLLALLMVGAQLYCSEEYEAGRLTWDWDPNNDLGFPVPSNIRDVLPPNSTL